MYSLSNLVNDKKNELNNRFSIIAQGDQNKSGKLNNIINKIKIKYGSFSKNRRNYYNFFKLLS